MTAHSKSTEPTPSERFKQLARQVISVPKAEIDRREAEYQKARKNKRKKRGL